MNMEILLKEFKTYKVDIEGRNSNSVDLYINHIKEFCEEMNIKDYKTFININAQIIKDWLSKQADKGNEPSTRNNKLSAIKQIYSYLETEKDILVDRKIGNIPLAKTPHKERKYADGDIAEQMIRMSPNERVRAGISVMQCTGVRFKEMIQINCADIERGFAVIKGKGGKERTIWFTPSCARICRDFINNKRKHIVERTGVKTDLLFIGDEGNVLTRQSFSKSLKICASRIGLYWSNEMSPHKLRHGFITEKLNKGVPIQVVRDMAGHSNMATTNNYSHSKEDAIKMAMLNEDAFRNIEED